jgi:hypothetical protein
MRNGSKRTSHPLSDRGEPSPYDTPFFLSQWMLGQALPLRSKVERKLILTLWRLASLF